VSNDKNLYDRRWRKRRAEQLRDHPLCALCMKLHRRVTVATIADHVVPHRGDHVLFEGPLQSVCKPCHDSVKQQQEKSGSFRGCDADGWPLDPCHPWRQEEKR
jgi:5-methylcytosine-specific restriction enzyme A